LLARDFPQIYQKHKATGLLYIDLDYEPPKEEENTMSTAPSTVAASAFAKGLDLKGVGKVNMPLKLRVKLMTKVGPKRW
jgi:hypothetical protein